MAVDSALLVARLPDLAPPHFLSSPISFASRRTRSRLVIVLVSDFFNDHGGISHAGTWDDVQRILTYVYVQATKVAQDINNILMHVDVLLRGVSAEFFPPALASQPVYATLSSPTDIKLPDNLLSLPHERLTASQSDSSLTTPVPAPGTPSLFPVVALGGTFDHLHAGHRILLSMAAWITSEKLIIGVTDDALLVRKSFANVLESLSTRMEHVRDFLCLFRPGISLDIVPISDVYGPTGWDPNIQALVVSKETLSGADAIAKYRQEKNLPPLRTFVIDVISPTSLILDHDDAELMKQTKMSSTFIRQWIVNGKCVSTPPRNRE
ncbi:Nucleotidylyl transferase [Fistulina hepatica ATCC 64428]|nr:Nucleotidylyl transferase [Fistulina hepatica ATCC 64428]